MSNWNYEKNLRMAHGKLRQLFKEYFNADCPI